ncbi:MAG: molybdenum cofactor guanylyltransferase MobA [Aestuariivirga sp.]
MKILGAIIAGGQSRRMGVREKTFLKLAGKPILAHVIERVAPQVDQLVINANGDPARFSEFGLAVIPDVVTTLTTPLAGLHAALGFAKRAGAEMLVTVPSDTPFLPADLVKRLLENGGNAAIAASGGQEHYIAGAWKTALLDDLGAAIAKDNLFRVKDWVQRISAQVVAWPTDPFDPFFNVNTPEDLQRAEQIAGAP